MDKQISSVQNPAIKRLLQLQEKSRARKKEGRFVVEGRREYSRAVTEGFEIEEVYLLENTTSEEEIDGMRSCSPNAAFIEVTSEVYEKIAYRGSTEGILAIGISKDLNIQNFRLDNPNPLILVTEAPEKPGNIGALLRTADAANLDAVFIANPKTDLFNPNIIRSSVGCVFSKRIATGTSSEIIEFLQKNNIAIYGAELQASVPYHCINYSSPSAIVVGTEDTGLSEEWLRNTSRNIIIPMQGKIDSMNVSVAAGILIFEAKRQRDFK